MGIQLYVNIFSIVADIISVFLLMVACTFLGYFLRIGVEFERKTKRWKEMDKRFQEVIEPMASYSKMAQNTGHKYSEEGFRGYLVSRGITYETWKAEIESLIRRRV